MSPIPFISSLTRRSRSRLGYSIFVLASLTVFGTIGFVVIEGWTVSQSLYMTVMTVTTVGYGPPGELSEAGRNFATLFMIVGVGAAAFALSSTVQALVQTELLAVIAERRRHREMNKLHDHFIICGGGRVGARVAREMSRAGANYVIVENDKEKAARFAEEGAHVLPGDATLEETLIEAGVERARGLAACLPNDADNLYVVLIARDLNDGLHIVARAIEEQAEPKLIRAGASRVIAPTIIGSHRMAESLMKPAVADFIDSIAADNLDLGFEQVEIAPHSIYAGKKLRSTNIGRELNTVVVAIRRRNGEMVFNPSGDAHVEAGDLLIAIGRAETIIELTRLAREPAPKTNS